MSETNRQELARADNGAALIAYSALIPALPLKDAAARFSEESDIEVQVIAGRPEQWMGNVAAGTAADLLCCGAEFLLDMAEAGGLVDPASRRSVGRRAAALLVPAGNPAGIARFEDLLESELRIGVAVEGCTLGLWDEIAGRLSSTEELRRRIAKRARGCGALLGLVSSGEIDVALGWRNFDKVPRFRVETVPLADELQVQRSTGLGIAAQSQHHERASAFLAWLGTPTASAIYRDWGWIVD